MQRTNSHNSVFSNLFTSGEGIEGNRNYQLSKDGNELYHFGIIDFLQTWTTGKKGERYSKMFFKQQAGGLISAIEPNDY